MIAETPVRILVTGGTLDKLHDPLREALGFGTASQVPDILARGRCSFPVVELLTLKDSLEFDDSDRERLAVAVAKSAETAVVVTHGTGTMGQSARYLADRVAGKTVVLTGAIRPFALGGSDASFNLGGAVIAAQVLAEGVWGVMNGRPIEAADLDKNTKTGRFV